MSTHLGFDAAYWYDQYKREKDYAMGRGRTARTLERQVERQRRTINALMEENRNLARPKKPVDEPVVNEGTSTLEERVNKLERAVETYSKVFDTVDTTLNVLIDRLKKLEQREPVEAAVDIKPLILKGAAMLDIADAINRSINKRGMK